MCVYEYSVAPRKRVANEFPEGLCNTFRLRHPFCGLYLFHIMETIFEGNSSSSRVSSNQIENKILTYVRLGLSVIPIKEGAKSPHWILGPKHTLLDVQSTPEQAQKWLDAGVTSWAVAGGAVSGNLVCLDFDEKNYPGLYDLWYEKLSTEQRAVVATCPISITRNNGHHVRYLTETSQPTQKLSIWIVDEEPETTSETKAEGGYALIPPSAGYTFIQGDLEHLPHVTDEMHEELIDIMRTFNEVAIEPATEYERRPGDTIEGDRPGARLNKHMSWEDILGPRGWVQESANHWRRPGKKAGEGISATTNFAGVPMFYVFSSSAAPFTENRGYSKFHTFALLNHKGDFSAAAKAAAELYPDGPSDGGSVAERDDVTQATQLVESIVGDPSIELFHDEYGTGFVRMPVGGHNQILSLSSREFKTLFSKTFYQANKKRTPSSTTLNNALGVLEGIAAFDGKEYLLKNRVAFVDDTVLYDLTNDAHQAVRVTKDGWAIEDNPPILFRRYSHQSPQVTPVRGGNVMEALDFVNVTDSDLRILFAVYLVSLFIPGYVHPMPYVFGAQGSAKSSFSRVLRRLVDPSRTEVLIFPKDRQELAQHLSHYYLSFYDNLHSISQDMSDVLCQAITGGGFSKRRLYSDSEDVIFSLKSNVGLNGISLISDKPDLLDRSILFELERIEEENRKDESEMTLAFEAARPRILGAIFEAVAGALARYPSIELTSKFRMADFTKWGAAIAETIGIGQDNFIAAYRRNVDSQNDEIIEGDMIATLIVGFMESHDEWSGTMTDLLKTLTEVLLDPSLDAHYVLPKSPKDLSRMLNVLKVPLQSVGIHMERTRNHSGRIIVLRKVSANIVISVTSVTD